jgi:hypothetical protein
MTLLFQQASRAEVFLHCLRISVRRVNLNYLTFIIAQQFYGVLSAADIL